LSGPAGNPHQTAITSGGAGDPALPARTGPGQGQSQRPESTWAIARAFERTDVILAGKGYVDGTYPASSGAPGRHGQRTAGNQCRHERRTAGRTAETGRHSNRQTRCRRSVGAAPKAAGSLTVGAATLPRFFP